MSLRLQMVFETEAGIGLMHLQMKDLEPSVWIGDAVVSCFVSILNFEDTYK
ncbi:hypothetical protein HanXRQr2_Chr14g0626171 [Helianthus annuus]|uniref:Uncharacterized protein n=1 Tax=Helianthus annuus TaxID=4232 RepID=A0A251RS00_HELAN|nr:hypothetical protein HanXRQr2_Chr14g0626171 [Helianthus annuus]KAJ0838954.1 hypothetical protein HanPSC8_Chr14g0600931 [Helianthus annuus]